MYTNTPLSTGSHTVSLAMSRLLTGKESKHSKQKVSSSSSSFSSVFTGSLEKQSASAFSAERLNTKEWMYADSHCPPSQSSCCQSRNLSSVQRWFKAGPGSPASSSAYTSGKPQKGAGVGAGPLCCRCCRWRRLAAPLSSPASPGLWVEPLPLPFSDDAWSLE